MTIVSSKVFLSNPALYFNLAKKEDIAVKRGKIVFQITPKSEFRNPSPSNDPFFAVPENVANLKKNIAKAEKQFAEGKYKTLSSTKNLEEYFDSL